jgi:UPF0716 protein FxsA
VPILLVAVFIVVPLAELYVILRVGDAIGALPTLAVLVADSVLGSLLLRSQGRAVWRRFSEALEQGRVPHREVLDGVLVIFGGAFLITPGFLTDIVGLALLIPPSRALVRRGLARRLTGRVAGGIAGGSGGRGRHARHPDAAGRPYDVDGTASEARPGELPAPRR